MRKIRLPRSAEEIKRRIRQVHDQGQFEGVLSREILSLGAGREVLPSELAAAIAIAISDYLHFSTYHPSLKVVVQALLPRWVDALVDDPEARKLVKDDLCRARLLPNEFREFR